MLPWAGLLIGPAPGGAQGSIEPPAAGPAFTAGFESRTRFERGWHPSFGREVEDPDGYLLQRTMLDGQWRIAPGLSTRLQLRSSLVGGRRAGPRASDKDTLDLNQGYVELSLPAQPGSLTARIGRQEIEFGTARLVTARDGLNDRLSFDGVRVMHQGTSGQWGAWVTRPVVTRPEAFDNRADGSQFFAAAYAATAGTDGLGVIVALRRADRVAYVQAAGSESRVTYAARASGRGAGWDHDWEAGLQRGRFANGPIRAWYVATETGWSPGRGPWRLGLRADAASGDKSSTDPALQTFHALFASTAFSGLAGLIGPANARDLAASVQYRPTAQLVLTAGTTRFWRTEAGDGIYSIGGAPLAGERLGSSRAVGRQVTLQAALDVGAASVLSVTASRFESSEALRRAGLAPTVGLFTAWWRVRH